MGKSCGHTAHSTNCFECSDASRRLENTQLRQQLKEAERERNLAIAHDRQPYPTAEAYELVCKRLEEARAELALVMKTDLEAVETMKNAHDAVVQQREELRTQLQEARAERDLRQQIRESQAAMITKLRDQLATTAASEVRLREALERIKTCGANARLIAKAPELLSSLKWALLRIEASSLDQGEHFKTARALVDELEENE